MVDEPEGISGLVDDNEEEEEAPPETSEKKGGGIVKLVVIVVAVIALIVVGWLGWTFGQSMFFPSGDASEGEPEEEIAVQSSEGEFDLENPPGVIEFDSAFLIKLRREEGIFKGDTYLKVNLTLEVASTEIQTEMNESSAVKSRISDIIITFFAGKYPDEIETSNWSRLKTELKSLINSQFPKEYRIQRINFREFIQQQK